MAELAGKRALVTGAASGIGRTAASALAAEGAAVALADIAPLDETLSVISAVGGMAQAFRCDVTDENEVTRLVRDAAQAFGGLDILVNNAGVMLEKPLLETTAADFDQIVGVNLRGVFLVGREAIRIMAGQASGGRVINTASDLGYLGRAEFSVYCASKGGVLALTRSWAREFAPSILVNAVAPGPIDTPMLDANHMSPEWRAKELEIPLARFGRPEEVASVILFLAGPGASYVTGQTFGPNGGSVMP